MTVHIMLDLETWGTTPGCDLRSIGACVFTPDNIEPWPEIAADHCFYIATDNPETPDDVGPHAKQMFPRKYSLTRDPATVKWWADQSSEAQAAFTDPVDLREALERFDAWLQDLVGPSMLGGLRLWSHGAAFDPPILAAAYRAVGLPVPWHYRAPRDTRTIFDAAGIDDHSAWLDARPGPLGLPHHALDDAICQARAVCAAMARITGWKRDSEYQAQRDNRFG